MKIVHVNSERAWRGGEQQLLLLAEGLRAVRSDVQQVVVAHPESALIERAREAGLRVVPIAMRGALDRRAARALRRALIAEAATAEAIDVVHAHTSHAHSIAWSALRGIRPVRPRLLVSRHVAYSIHRHVPLGLAKIKYNRQCDALLCVSRAVRQQLIRDGVNVDRLHVVPNGIDPAAWVRDAEARAEVRSALGIQSGDKVIGAIGALTPEKGHADLIDAFARLEPVARGRRLVLVGEGREHEALIARVAERQLEGLVHLVGFQANVRAWLSAFDVLATPSHAEGFPLGPLQGMAAGLPVVATRAGGIVEQIEDGVHGRLVPIGDPEALATALAEVLSDPEAAANLGYAAAAHVAEAFHFHGTAERTAALYDQILAPLGAPPRNPGS